MTMTLAIDPGKISGLVWGWFDEATPWHQVHVEAWDFEEFSTMIWNAEVNWGDHLIVERFVPQSGGDFTLKENDLAGVETIGMIRHANTASEVYWRTRADKSQVNDQVLKDNGLWVTGKKVRWTDGRDVNDATIHSLGHVAFTLEHAPTLTKYFHA